MQNTPPALEFKSSTFFAPILILFTNDMAAIEQTLYEKIKLVPDFFKDSPLIIDFKELNKSSLAVDFEQLVRLLRNAGFFPVGIRGGNEQQNKQARALFIPIDTVRGQDNPISFGETAKPAASRASGISETVLPQTAIRPAAIPPVPAATTLITQPIR
ncbi:MAG: septum site-determining protein MinC, partial [Nitrosomonas sp.]